MGVEIDPHLFHEFQTKVILRLQLPLTTRKMLEEFADIDVNTEVVAKIVHRNQYFERMLLFEIEALGLKENTPKIQAAIAMLGITRVRDFVCALQVIRSVGRRYPEKTKQGKLDLKPAEILKYALQTEEHAAVHNLGHADTAYAAGMMFDWVQAIGREVFDVDKAFDEYVKEVHKHGLRTARVGAEIVKTQKNFSYSKYVFAACLVHDIGKLAMALMFPGKDSSSYLGFRAEISKSKKPLTREMIYFMEQKRFGITHDYLGSLMVYAFGIFRGVEKCILFHHEPYLVRAHNKDVYALAALIALSSNVANNFRIPKDTTDTVYKTWFTSEVQEFKVETKQMMNIMLALGRQSI